MVTDMTFRSLGPFLSESLFHEFFYFPLHKLIVLRIRSSTSYPNIILANYLAEQNDMTLTYMPPDRIYYDEFCRIFQICHLNLAVFRLTEESVS